jgi:hypothetical protein
MNLQKHAMSHEFNVTHIYCVTQRKIQSLDAEKSRSHMNGNTKAKEGRRPCVDDTGARCPALESRTGSQSVPTLHSSFLLRRNQLTKSLEHTPP